jgi:septum formation protein|tara:strand:+ start:433 stop:1020 length:588 start_codon:yes stop_codon:yes gene_type:complete
MIQNKKIILASKSPRRQELLGKLDVTFDIQLKDIDEVFPPELDPFKVPEYLALLKSEVFNGKVAEDTVVITSDTVVINNNKIMGKPSDVTDALSMVLELSEKTHFVITGVCLQFSNRKISFSSVSEVEFESISEQEAKYYIDKFKPLDKAGAYGVQEWIGQAKIKRINGCYYNIMGLPLNALYNTLIEEEVIRLA